MSRFLAPLVVLVSTLPAFCQIPEGIRVVRELPYQESPHERQKLDLYLPTEAKEPLPMIIWIHGGAWMSGSKDPCPVARFASMGYAVASINYRLSQHAIFPAQIEDCKAAVRWLRAHAGEHQLDPDRFAVWGVSAGGHLAALLGTSGHVKEFDVGENLHVSSRVQAVIDFFGPIDLTRMEEHEVAGSVIDHNAPRSPESRLIGGAVQDNKEKAAKANPITYITKESPPFLIRHGELDKLVSPFQSQLLHDALQKAGVPSILKIIPRTGHRFEGPEAAKDAAEFLEAHLTKKKAE